MRGLLGRRGFEVLEAADGAEGLRLLYAEKPELVLLDVTMPELDGWETLDRIRALTDVPVIMLSALDSHAEKVRGLQGGADDYVTKPFGGQELIARIERLLQRKGTNGGETHEHYDDGMLSIDFETFRVEANGRSIELTPLEFRVLSALVRHPNQVLSPDQLLEHAWGGAHRASRDQVKLYVGYLRRKLGTRTASRIETRRGFGYRYRPASTG